jgi:hypothetical protein
MPGRNNAGGTINRCAILGVQDYLAPLQDPNNPGIRKDIKLIRLASPFRLTGDGSNFSIAQRLYYGTEASLDGATVHIFGQGRVPPTYTFTSAFATVSGVGSQYSYLVTSTIPATR